ncbi:hypothetical protein [Halorubrum halodurans]|uniref:Uncharacterized protein n=1 Tax=Halorubrum halodurans TaxID=1383851 RepID=A0A256ICP6_9EURY|nr:hypothetical protein [Halorubrum halodurans]OYR54325.1 hypothetical protein DJ70_14165 [Halorubrum halodurans]
MTEFETQNTVDVVVDDRSLTEAKADVEEAFSSVPMDIQAEVSATGGGSEVAARDRARQRQLLTDQTESLEELGETLEEADIEGEWQAEHELSRERNRLLERLVDVQEEGNFDRAARSGGGLLGGGAAILGGGALLGIGALSSVLSGFSWPSLPEFSWPDLPDLDPPAEPDWHPLDVVEPEPAPVEEPSEAPVAEPDPVEVTEPEPVEVAEPDPVEVAETDPMEVAEPDPAEYPLEDPEPVEVAEPAWTPLEIADPTTAETGSASGSGSGIGLPELLAGGIGGAFGIKAIQQFGSQAAIRGSSAASGGAFMTPEGLGMTDFEDQNRARSWVNERTPESFQLRELDSANEHPGSVFSAEGRQAQAEGLKNIANRIEDAIANLSGDGSTEVRNQFDYNIEVLAKGATERDVERAMDRAKNQAIREFERTVRTSASGQY